VAAASIATSLVRGIGLRADFRFQGDRFAHVVSLIGRGESPIPLLESVEGTAADAWPASPPLQSLHVETLQDGRRAVLLVGMAGRGHWSASIEALRDSAVLLFDIACRTSESGVMLASTYRDSTPRGGQPFASADRSGIYDPDGELATVVKPSDDPTARSALMNVDAASFAIVPAQRGGGTIRWKYRVELLTPDPRLLTPDP
jgi:hypothetical protein